MRQSLFEKLNQPTTTRVEEKEISSNKKPQNACKHLTKPIQLFVLLSHAAVGNEAETER